MSADNRPSTSQQASPTSQQAPPSSQQGPPPTQQAPPPSAFEMLSGLINKTSAPGTPASDVKKDPMQMLAGLMKTVKPPEVGAAVVKPQPNEANVTVKTEATEGDTFNKSTDNTQVKTEVKQEPKVEFKPTDQTVKSEPGAVKTEPSDAGSEPGLSTTGETLFISDVTWKMLYPRATNLVSLLCSNLAS